MHSDDSVAVSVKGLRKVFPGGVTALDDVSLDVYSGEILALLGENGSGKSTLVKVLYGVYVPDSGEVRVNVGGRLTKVHIREPIEAMRYGIVLVSQVPQLIDKLSVAENLALTLSSLKWKGSTPLSRVSRFSRVIEKECERLGFKIDPNEKVYNLTYTQKQQVELLRSLVIDARVLLLDEVLTYLPTREKRKFYDILLKLRGEGKSIVLITHKLPEAFEVSDRIAVMRNGKILGVVNTKDVTLREVRSMMFGAAAQLLANDKTLLRKAVKAPKGEEIVVEGLHVKDDYGRDVVNGVNLVVRSGEIVGIAGVAGNGQRELLEAVVGLRRPERGTVRIAGLDITKKGAKLVRSLGVSFIPDRPLEYGCSIDHSVLDNVAVPFSLANGMLLKWDRLREVAEKIVSEYQVVAPGVEASLKSLSGGNIMKVVVSKEIESASRAIVAYNPTRALDEVAAAFVRQRIRVKAEKDEVAVLMASEDLDEVLLMSDAVYVANSGRLYGPLDPKSTPREEVEKLMVM
jgi:simple sugar transport system ATP-binding protein